MSVSVLIITHNSIGASLLGTVNFILKDIPIKTKVLSASQHSDIEELVEKALLIVREIDDGDGVLVLTDLLGSTPNNIAAKLLDHNNVSVVSGINLPMLLRVMNYPDLDIDQLTEKAISGGMDGISRL